MGRDAQHYVFEIYEWWDVDEMCSKAILLVICLTVINAGSDAPPKPAELGTELNRALLVAVRGHQMDAVKQLLSRGAEPNVIETNTHDGDTALIAAIRNGDIEIVRLLLEAGANVNLRQHGYSDGTTPLMSAAASGQTELVQLLVDAGANVNARTLVSGAGPTALYWAIANRHSAAVTLLLASGAVIAPRDFFSAISTGQADILQQLMEAGADRNWVSEAGHTAVEEAASSPATTRSQILAVLRDGRVPKPKR